MQVKGKVTQVLPTQSGVSKSGNEWRKCSFILETEGKYPKPICFTLFGDHAEACPRVGETVEVHFDITSREYNGRWYSDIQAWKIERPEVASAPQPYIPPRQTTIGWEKAWQGAAGSGSVDNGNTDDLPF